MERYRLRSIKKRIESHFETLLMRKKRNLEIFLKISNSELQYVNRLTIVL